jgi:hypothetical protein
MLGIQRLKQRIGGDGKRRWQKRRPRERRSISGKRGGQNQNRSTRKQTVRLYERKGEVVLISIDINRSF